jgi:hypothetical protein
MLQEPALDVGQLIGEVAKRHNILLGTDEPYFIMLTLNELVVSRYVEFILRHIEAVRDQTAIDRADQLEAAKKLGESIVTAAAEYVASQHRASVTEHSDALARAATIEQYTIEAQARSARKVIFWSAVIAGLTGCVFLGAVLASWVLAPSPARLLHCPHLAAGGEP